MNGSRILNRILPKNFCQKNCTKSRFWSAANFDIISGMETKRANHGVTFHVLIVSPRMLKKIIYIFTLSQQSEKEI